MKEIDKDQIIIIRYIYRIMYPKIKNIKPQHKIIIIYQEVNIPWEI